jgi:hypothetical protein
MRIEYRPETGDEGCLQSWLNVPASNGMKHLGDDI